MFSMPVVKIPDKLSFFFQLLAPQNYQMKTVYDMSTLPITAEI